MTEAIFLLSLYLAGFVILLGVSAVVTFTLYTLRLLPAWMRREIDAELGRTRLQARPACGVAGCACR